MLLGWAARLRPGDLVVLDAGDVSIDDDGATVRVRRGGVVEMIVVPRFPDRDTCPVRALEAWITSRTPPYRDQSGWWATHAPLFWGVHRYTGPSYRPITPQVVTLAVKAAARAAGLEPGRYSGDTLRRA